MVSEKFRYQLRQEVEQWQAEGLINQQLYETITHRYQFSALETSARNRFVMILLGLGSVLLGLAVITFVAANWQVWSRGVRVVLLLSLFVGVNTAGFYLWRYPTERWSSRLGQGLLLLGALILGANMALMSQMFHASGEVYQLYLLWGLGVVAMAYSLRLTLLGILAVILVGIGFTLSMPELFRPGEYSLFQQVVQHLPLLASVIFVPLAYWCRSRWLFGLTAVLVVFALEMNLSQQVSALLYLFTAIAGMVAAIAFAVPPMLLWAYRDSLWGLPSEEDNSFAPVARNLAIVFLSLLFYLFSFHSYWESSPIPETATLSWREWLTLLDAFVVGGLAIFAWWRLGYAENRSRWQLDFTSTVVALMSALAAIIVWLHISVGALGASATLSYNALLATLAIGLIREALATGKRRGFWGGILLIVLQIFSRMIEYNTGLVFKAVVLFLCGMAIILAGLWFERYLHRRAGSSR